MVGRVGVGCFDEVGVYAEGRSRVRVTEAAADGLHVLAAGEKHRRREVTQIVEAHALEAEVVT